jgi:hypothetical protein
MKKIGHLSFGHWTMPLGGALPAPERTAKVLRSPCRLETGWFFYSFPEIPFAYERQLCAMSGRSITAAHSAN